MKIRDALEPVYARFLQYATLGRGVRWQVDERTALRIDPRCRWIRNPSYEKAVVDYLRARVRPGDCCVDVGAHVGFYALQMAQWTAPGGSVIAFEPNPLARDVLERNVRLNGLDERIAVEPLAVAGAAGRAPLYHGQATSGLSRIGAPNPHSASGEAIDVEVVTLDHYCAAHAALPQWILVDTEGYELDVLIGASGLLSDRRISFVIEMHPELWPRGRQATAVHFEHLIRTCGRRVVPLTGQRDALEEYGTIVIA